MCLIFIFLFFSLSLHSASLDAFPKEDKVVRIHDFFSITCYYNVMNFIKRMFHFQKEVKC